MFRLAIGLGLIASTHMGWGQAAHLTISADFNPQLRFTTEGAARFRMYNDDGEHSRVRLGVTLENGWIVRLYQKIGRIDNDPDESGTEEAYLEKPGWWQAGKFYIPFGGGRIIRETGIGFKLDTTFAFVDLPIEAAYIYNGSRKQRGFVARIGAPIGVSVAYGEHFGIGGTALTQIRFPESSPGEGRGYGLIAGVDLQKTISGFDTSVEYMWLRNGATVLDADEELLNVRVAYQFPFGPLIEAESTFTFRDPTTNLRFGAQLAGADKIFFVPSVRYYQKTGWRIGIGLRIRI